MGEAMTRWRLVGLGACLALALAVLVLGLGGADKSHAVPEGGSSFGAGPPRDRGAKGAGPMDALAPVLTGDGGPGPAATAKAAKAVIPSGTGAAGAGGPPASQARAAARLFLVGFGGPTATRAILDRFALHEWGGVVLEPGNGTSPQQVADLIGRIGGAAARAGHQAPLIAASQLGGPLDAVPVGAPLQSTAADATAAHAGALAVAKALHPLGVGMVLAPDADIGFAGGPWEGVAFSDDPTTVAQLTAAAVSGWKDGQIAAAPGHFPGEGAASGDPALEAATVGQSPAIQLSSATYVAYDGVTPATLLPDVVALLRKDLKFDGVIVSGDLAAASLAGGQPVATLAVQAIKAGVDLLWIPGDAADQDAAWRAVVRALRTGEIPAARVADALQRVSLLRATYGVK
jgi:beta-N-acetylhexosaminidase